MVTFTLPKDLGEAIVFLNFSDEILEIKPTEDSPIVRFDEDNIPYIAGWKTYVLSDDGTARVIAK